MNVKNPPPFVHVKVLITSERYCPVCDQTWEVKEYSWATIYSKIDYDTTISTDRTCPNCNMTHDAYEGGYVVKQVNPVEPVLHLFEKKTMFETLLESTFIKYFLRSLKIISVILYSIIIYLLLKKYLL